MSNHDAQKLPDSLAGHFLISDTNLIDPNFHKTVVLITDHSPEGAFGLVVNRSAGVTMQDVLDDFRGSAAGSIPVYVGGPVEQQYLFLLHDGLDGAEIPEPSASPIKGVVFQPLTETIAHTLHSGIHESAEGMKKRVHVYAGYSGWAAGQLEAEIAEGAWITHPATPEIIFHSDPARGWQDAMSSKGELYRIIAQTGFRPSVN